MHTCTYIFDYCLLIRTSVACAVVPGGGGGGGRQNMRVPPQPINSHHPTGLKMQIIGHFAQVRLCITDHVHDNNKWDIVLSIFNIT